MLLFLSWYHFCPSLINTYIFTLRTCPYMRLSHIRYLWCHWFKLWGFQGVSVKQRMKFRFKNVGTNKVNKRMFWSFSWFKVNMKCCGFTNKTHVHTSAAHPLVWVRLTGQHLGARCPGWWWSPQGAGLRVRALCMGSPEVGGEQRWGAVDTSTDNNLTTEPRPVHGEHRPVHGEHRAVQLVSAHMLTSLQYSVYLHCELQGGGGAVDCMMASDRCCCSCWWRWRWWREYASYRIQDRVFRIRHRHGAPCVGLQRDRGVGVGGSAALRCYTGAMVAVGILSASQADPTPCMCACATPTTWSCPVNRANPRGLCCNRNNKEVCGMSAPTPITLPSHVVLSLSFRFPVTWLFVPFSLLQTTNWSH